MRRMRSLLVLFVLGAVAGCQTQFIGDPHIEPVTCQAKCREANMVMAGMVYLGQYSSACLCEVARPAAAPGIAPPGAAPPSAAAPGGGASGTVALASGALGAAVGVIMQMRTAEQQNLSQPMMPTTPPNVVPMGPRM
jgi:hypothetical protein